ncbi:NUDIX domain-containing protein [Streptosporangium sp. DT93]|uniref:NUDIX domain-containing protein n=1 Tax=Streptosporangium sp. DT93 TaxID=3393428 RepID=UPI003CF7644F
MTAHLLVLDEVGRWLILRTTRDRDRWQLPGGRAHHGESPAAAATREAREETGLSLHVERLITVAWVPAGNTGRRDRIAFVFSTRTVRWQDLRAITLQTSEVDAWQLAPAHRATAQLHPLIAERLTEAELHGPGHYIDQDPGSIRERTVMP